MTTREKAILWLNSFVKNKEPMTLIPKQLIRLMYDALTEQPEIVRCKDCRYWLPMDRFHQDYHTDRGDCELNCWVRDSEWFCAEGKRRDEDDRQGEGNQRF